MIFPLKLMEGPSIYSHFLFFQQRNLRRRASEDHRGVLDEMYGCEESPAVGEGVSGAAPADLTMNSEKVKEHTGLNTTIYLDLNVIYDQINKLLDSFHNFTRCFSIFAIYIYVYIYIHRTSWMGWHALCHLKNWGPFLHHESMISRVWKPNEKWINTTRRDPQDIEQLPSNCHPNIIRSHFYVKGDIYIYIWVTYYIYNMKYVIVIGYNMKKTFV